MTWGRTRRGPRSINADDSGSEEERATGGPGPGAADPGERGVLTDRMMADCGGVGPTITCVGLTYGMGRVDRLVAGLTSFYSRSIQRNVVEPCKDSNGIGY